MTRWLIVLLILLPIAAFSQDERKTRIMGGYVTGREYMDMDGLEKKAYIRGLLDGMLLAPAFGAKEEDMEWFVACTKGLDITDIRKYLYEYIRSRSDLWDNPNAAKSFRAMRDLCIERARKS
ncbi:MAG: hypothetical protein U1F33_05540 [Alphaproteobacteria bacterium]